MRLRVSLLLLGIAAVWIAYPWLFVVLLHFAGWEDFFPFSSERMGAFGDTFGALNALFSGLAFTGIIISIYIQSRELKYTQEQLEGQKNALNQQAFENTFFSMLTLHNAIVNSFKYSKSTSPAKIIRSISDVRVAENRDCFPEILADFYDGYLWDKDRVIAHTMYSASFIDDGSKYPVEDLYEKFYIKHAHHVLGHYFRNLYQILKYIDCSTVSDKKFYTNIVRAQLSSSELFLLFFNALSSYGKEKMKPLLEKYSFFEHLPIDGKIMPSDAKKFDTQVFGTNQDWDRYLAQVQKSN